MRTGLPGLLLLSALLGSFPPIRPAFAQVTVNPGALDLLPAGPRAAVARDRAPRGQSTPSRPRPRPGAVARTPATNAPAATSAILPGANPGAAATAATAAAGMAPPPKPALPTIPPAVAALPPPAPVPPARPQPPPVMHVTANAAGVASPLPGGVRVTFGPDSQDLNPATEAALRTVAQRLRATDQATVNIFAYAEGAPDDPSVARRLALARALTARAVLISEGVASTRIYPRSMPTVDGDPERNRIDVVVVTPRPADAASPAANGAATPAAAAR